MEREVGKDRNRNTLQTMQMGDRTAPKERERQSKGNKSVKN